MQLYFLGMVKAIYCHLGVNETRTLLRPPHTPFDPVAPLPLDNGLRSPVLSHHAPQRDGVSYTLSGCKR